MHYGKFSYTRQELSANKLKLHPVCCWHLGARQSDIKFIQSVIKEIKRDPAARWFYMGDGGECVTKLSKGNIFEQLLSPQEQKDILVDLMGPIASKCLFGIRGNHGNRTTMESGLSFDANLMATLGVPYFDISALVNITVERSSYDLFTHHGVQSGAALQSKVTAAKKFGHIDADIKVTGHSHVAMDLDPEYVTYLDNSSGRVRKKKVTQVIAGCAYDSSVPGYAEEKGYSPILPGRTVLELDGRIIQGKAQKNVDVRVIRSQGDYDVAGPTVKFTHRWQEKGM